MSVHLRGTLAAGLLEESADVMTDYTLTHVTFTLCPLLNLRATVIVTATVILCFIFLVLQ